MNEKIKRDELFETAAKLIVETQSGSVSLLQRRLGLSYNRAQNIMSELEECGIVGEFTGVKMREVKYKNLKTLNSFLEELKAIEQ